MASVLTRQRHRDAVGKALAELDLFRQTRQDGLEIAVASTHLHAAVTALDQVIGTVVPDDVLEIVFGTFCVGK